MSKNGSHISFSVNISTELLDRLDKLANEMKISRSKVIEKLCTQALNFQELLKVNNKISLSS